MLAFDEQRTHDGTLIGELAETGERPALRGRHAAKLADGAGPDGAFQVRVQVSLGQRAKIPHRQDPTPGVPPLIRLMEPGAGWKGGCS